MSGRAGKSTRVDKLPICCEYPIIHIFAKARLQWFSFAEFKRSSPVGLPFGPQEHGILHVFIIKAMREFIQMRHEEHLDALFQ